MHSHEPVDIRMRMDVIGQTGEPRTGATPLIFKSAFRQGVPAEAEAIFHAGQTQQEADLVEDLRGQIKALQRKVEMVRTESRAEGRKEASEASAASIERERAAIAEACTRFAADRERYFTSVEAEVVRLALAIAARILHREARMDPLLLAASVRVALEKLAGQPGAILRVPAADGPSWRTLFPDSAIAEVAESGDLAPGDLILESPVGRVELGIPVQLEEIEKGFFDLLQKRPS